MKELEYGVLSEGTGYVYGPWPTVRGAENNLIYKDDVLVCRTQQGKWIPFPITEERDLLAELEELVRERRDAESSIQRERLNRKAPLLPWSTGYTVALAAVLDDIRKLRENVE